MQIEPVPIPPQRPSGLSRTGLHPAGNQGTRETKESGEPRVIDLAHTSPLSRIVSREMMHLRKERSEVSPDAGKSISFDPDRSLPDAVVDTIYKRMQGE